MVEEITLKKILAEPRTIEELHIPQNMIIDLIFRILYNEGNVALSRFTEVLKISKNIIDEILMWMQKEHLCEVSKATVELGRLGNVYSLTDAGELRARAAMERSQYIGPVPVSIPYYNRGIELQTKTHQRISAERVKEAISSLILPKDFHRKIGPAINSGSSIFLYGPPGNGKTSIAMEIGKLLGGSDSLWVPYSITASGQIIQIHDRLVHKQIPIERGRTAELGRIDQRWALINRPAVTAGGELKMESLDLRFDPISKFYEAPLQLKANGGMLLIDDFGRQQVSPRDLLNRWIVPLESFIDFLRLQSGQTIVVPFRQLIVFSTNLDPNELVDDAFLRRIHMKIGVIPPSYQLFFQIFKKTAKDLGIPFEKDAFIHLLSRWYKQTGRPLQAVHPRDILNILKAICEYTNEEPRMTSALMDEACENYFVN
jgi:predicted ATPase with chaperone activity